MKLEHVHLTVNAKVGPGFRELPKADAQRFVDRLMKEINMKPLGPLVWSPAEDLEFPGQSFVQMITTSHCSLHYFSDTKEIYFDLYSCRSFDENKAVGLLEEFFRLEEWHGILYKRATNEKPKVMALGNRKTKQTMIAKARC